MMLKKMIFFIEYDGHVKNNLIYETQSLFNIYACIEIVSLVSCILFIRLVLLLESILKICLSANLMSENLIQKIWCLKICCRKNLLDPQPVSVAMLRRIKLQLEE